MNVRLTRFFLMAAFAGLTACGGSNTGGIEPPPTTNPPPDDNSVGADEIRLAGRIAALEGDGEVAVYINDKEFAAEVAADGTYIVDIRKADLVANAAMRIEARGVGEQDGLRLLSVVPDAGVINGLAGTDRIVEEAELSAVSPNELTTGLYAVLVAAADGEHIALTKQLNELQRDRLDGELAIQLAAAVRLANEGAAFPAGTDDTWSLIQDLDRVKAFFDGVRATEAADKRDFDVKAGDEVDRVTETVAAIVNDPSLGVPFAADSPPSSFYRTTTISRDLDKLMGLMLFFDGDGTGEIRNEGGDDTMTWSIDADGRLTIVPDNGLPFIEAGTDGSGNDYEIGTFTDRILFTRLQQGHLADLLHAQIERRQAFLDEAHADDEPPFPFVELARSMIAVRPGGQINWNQEEPVGTWALPGVMGSEYQVNAVQVPVQVDDLYEFRIDEDGVGRGAALLTGEGFTWQFDGDASSDKAGLLVNFDSDGSGVTFKKVRVDGSAFDMTSQGAVIRPGAGENPTSDDLVKFTSGSLGFKRDAEFTFTETNVAGEWLLFGAANPLFDRAAFKLRVNADQTARTINVEADGSETVSPNVRRWDIDAQGRMIVTARFNTSTAEDDPFCTDTATCWTPHERITYPVRRDGNRIYVIEQQFNYGRDDSNTSDFLKGEVLGKQTHIRYWDISPASVD